MLLFRTIIGSKSTRSVRKVIPVKPRAIQRRNVFSIAAGESIDASVPGPYKQTTSPQLGTTHRSTTAADSAAEADWTPLPIKSPAKRTSLRIQNSGDLGKQLTGTPAQHLSKKYCLNMSILTLH